MPNPSNSNRDRLEDGREQDHSNTTPLSSCSDRRTFLQGAAATAAASAATVAWPAWAHSETAAGDLDAIRGEIEKRHHESVKRLQDWIRQPSIAAENRGMNEGCDMMMRMLREAGFQQATKVSTDGQPGVFATLDAGAPRTLGLYYMYDVKQADPAEWSSPPFEAALVDKPGLGKVVMGRGAGSIVSRGATRDSGRREEAAHEFGIRCRGRRGNRLAALSADCAPARGDGGPEELPRNFHAERLARARRRSHHDAGREGSHRVRADFQR
jgi:hypothetical protein